MSGKRVVIAVAALGVAALVIILWPTEPPPPPPAPKKVEIPEPEPVPEAIVKRVTGQVEKLSPVGGWVPLRQGERLSQDATMRTAKSASAELGIGDDSVIGVGENSQIEILEVTPALREAFMRGASRTHQEEIARRAGWRHLQMAGFCKIVRGETTIEEVLRVVPVSVDSREEESAGVLMPS